MMLYARLCNERQCFHASVSWCRDVPAARDPLHGPCVSQRTNQGTRCVSIGSWRRQMQLRVTCCQRDRIGSIAVFRHIRRWTYISAYSLIISAFPGSWKLDRMRSPIRRTDGRTRRSRSLESSCEFRAAVVRLEATRVTRTRVGPLLFPTRDTAVWPFVYFQFSKTPGLIAMLSRKAYSESRTFSFDPYSCIKHLHACRIDRAVKQTPLHDSGQAYKLTAHASKKGIVSPLDNSRVSEYLES